MDNEVPKGVEVDWARVLRLSNGAMNGMANAVDAEDKKGAKKIEMSLAMMVATITTTHALLDTLDKGEVAAEFKREMNWFAAEWAAGNVPITVKTPNGEPVE